MRTIAAFVALISLAMASVDFLYDNDESKPVIEHNPDHDFENSSKPRLVEFYSPYCGACRSFRPTYIALAETLIDMYADVEVYAVSCTPHKEICKKYEVTGYPSLYAFPAEEEKGVLLKKATMGGYSAASIAAALSLTIKNGGLIGQQVERKLVGEAGADEDQTDEGDGGDGDGDGDGGDKESDGGEGDDEKGEDEDDGDEDEDDAGNEKENQLVGNVKIAVSKDERSVLAENDKNEKENEDNDEASKTPASKDKGGDDEIAENSAGEDNELGREDRGKKDDEHNDEEKDMLRDGRAAVAYRAMAARQVPGSSGITPDASTEGGALKKAGALAAANLARGMDRYAALIEKRKKIFDGKKDTKFFVRKVRKDSGPGGEVVLEKIGRSGETSLMRANKPGTSEFELRKKEMLDKIAKDVGRRNGLFGSSKIEVNGLMNKLKLPFKKEPRPVGMVRKTFESIPVVKRIFKMSPEEELILDVSLSFVTGLKHGVFMSDGPLSDEKKAALLGWFNLLSIGLPPEWGLHALIDRLTRQLEFISKSDQNLQEVINSYPMSRQTWSRECRKHDGGIGFSCGIWKLLHVVTVGVAEHRGGQNLVQSGLMTEDTTIFSPSAAAEAIYDYMNNFFGCTECRENFVIQYNNCSFRRCERLTDDTSAASADDWKQLALWMWEVHNEVNVRVGNKRFTQLQKKLEAQHLQGAQQLKISRTDADSDEIRSIWPSLEKCIMCFDDDGRWNEFSVFEYLERTYWDAPNSKFDRLLTQRQVEGEDPTGGGFVWMMVILAVAIVALVRSHLNNIGFRKQLRKFNVGSSVIGVKHKIEDVVAGKNRTA